MDKQWIIKEAERHVSSLHKEDTTGHDFEHIMRVRHLALDIAKHEKIDIFIVELASLLHDSVDRKLFKDANKAWDNLYVWMNKVQLSTEIQKEIIHILKYISYKGGKNKGKLNSLAGKVVQDADRIDALGAIGIARTFQFAGHFNEPMHITDSKPRDLNTITADQYHNEPNTAINHFYEKLLLLKDQMNTVRGKEIAEDRHKFMIMFLEQFFEEWNVGI
ncbi:MULTISPECIES: HD domain-containing protein [Mammaliicoccus]|uniref:HD domain-containing protein n=1 Tax=Mammaliicoccus lentus TaxID=42858 RepID=A0ABS6GXD1_MAMLE|nr:HD domain-containing protein [Mammaliicoccus lentus]MBF0842949.1 HD domain-containing protein [Mammaliicoccus lentus]MBU6113001.1 HD domain-containing protein [Mammaliicoccus lentus]